MAVSLGLSCEPKLSPGGTFTKVRPRDPLGEFFDGDDIRVCLFERIHSAGMQQV